jgi:Methylamine utilisation protein MauE
VTEPALVLAPLACAVVLVLSGVAKYGDPDATRAAFVSMRVPKALSSTTVRLLPGAEIALGGLLLVTSGWALAVVGAVVTALFAAYWVLVALVLRRGDEVDCGCFGATGDDRVTGATLARNTLLVGLAALATGFGAAGSGLLPALGDLSTGDGVWLVMAAAVTAVAVLVVGRRQSADVIEEEELLDYQREPIPFALLRDADDNTTTLRELAAERPQLLLLLSSSCGAWHDVAAFVPGWVERLAPVEVQLLFSEPLEWLPAEVTPAGAKVWYDVENGAGFAFAAGRPSAVLLGADQMLAGGPVAGTAAIKAFIADVIAEIESAEVPLAELVVPNDEGYGHDGHDHDGHDHDGHAQVADRTS